NGVPPPASTIQARTKPMQVTPATVGNAAPVPPSAITAVPPGDKPAYNAAEPAPRYVRPAPTAAPPVAPAITSAPPARAVPLEATRGRAPVVQREATPPS